MDFYELGQQLRQLRRLQGISQQQIAGDLGLSRATVNALEKGRSGDVGVRKVLSILDYLGYEVKLREKSPFPTLEVLAGE
jgi:transcriptional regulator with XRE-family HTH domain